MYKSCIPHAIYTMSWYNNICICISNVYNVYDVYCILCIYSAIDQGTRLAAVIEDAKTGDVFDAPVGLAPKLKKTFEDFIGKNKNK